MVFYGLAKLVAYVFWCYVGIGCLTKEEPFFPQAVGLGTIRWFLGVVIGFLLFWTVRVPSREAAETAYVMVYFPVRVIEWTIMALVIKSERGETGRLSLVGTLVWVLGGILLSFGTDFLSPDGFAGRFCIGRCLC